MKNSYAEQIKSAKEMLGGLKANQDILTQWGVDQAYLANFDKLYQDTQDYGNEQQALKSRLKEKTAAVNANLTALRKLRRNGRHMVKDQFPQESWKEFGVAATR